MRIAVAGGTGFLGTALVAQLLADGHQVTILTRRAQENPQGYTLFVWDPSRPSGLEVVLNGYDAVVNLAGASIADGRWTDKRKKVLLDSRLSTTAALAQAIGRCPQKPKVLVNASAVGYYGCRGDEALTEESPSGEGFLASVCRQWEAAALSASTRVVCLRFGIILGKSGGALRKMLLPFKLGLGGRLGSGDQWMSWIHVRDATGMVLAAAADKAWEGAFNATAPHPVTNREFAKTLGAVLWRPAVLPAPAAALRALMGPMADELLLGGQKAFPEKAKKAGFHFKFASLKHALEDVLRP